MDRKSKEYSTIERQKMLQSFDLSRIIVPIAIGIIAVAGLFYWQFDHNEFAQITWDKVTLLFFSIALLFLIGRIVFYALRLYILADRYFSFWKCIQLIFLWEFSSAVSPTNVGGSAVALFILSQEKIGAAKTTAIVIYTIVLDTFFFLFSIFIWLVVFGSDILGPGKESFGGWEVSLTTAYIIMIIYGTFFAYGLFVKPLALKQLLRGIGKIGFLKRYRSKLEQLGEDIVVTSEDLVKKDLQYHLSAFLATAGAWSCRFLLIIALIMGIAKSVPFAFKPVLELYARIQTMFVMMAVSPTPGGAGFAEILFGNLLTDYVPRGISLVIASIWRIMAYYFFLIMGLVIVPQWLRTVIRSRKDRKIAADKP